jgi:hypothetical protein
VKPAAAAPARRASLLWPVGVITVVAVAIPLLLDLLSPRLGLPGTVDCSTSRLSAHGLYRVSYTASIEPVLVNRLHTWRLRVERPDGTRVENAAITVEGRMPRHDHGLPTQPVARSGGGGEYLVEGIRFQMGGWWVVDLGVTAGGRTDHVTFNLELGPPARGSAGAGVARTAW